MLNPSPLRCTRVLLVLGPVAGVLGGLLGALVGMNSPAGVGGILPSDLGGLVIANSCLGFLGALLGAGVGWGRGRPVHALKACSLVALGLFFPGIIVGFLIQAAGC